MCIGKQVSHLHDTMCSLHSVDIVVGYAHSFCQALLLAVHQPSAECIICPGVEDWEARPVNLIQVHALLL